MPDTMAKATKMKNATKPSTITALIARFAALAGRPRRNRLASLSRWLIPPGMAALAKYDELSCR